MRIVHVITRLSRAGTEENMIANCLAQVEDDHEVYVVHGRDHAAYDTTRFTDRITFLCEGNLVRQINPIRDVRATAALTRLFLDLAPDVVHTHQSKAGIIGRIAARRARTSLIVHGVHIVPFQNAGPLGAKMYVWIERYCARFTDLLIHVSAGTLQQYADHRIGAGCLQVVAESGMDVMKFRGAQPPPDVARLAENPVGGEEKPFVILSMASLEPRKRVRKFLPVFRDVVAARPQTVLLLAGEGPEAGAIAEAVSSLGLERHVRLLGFRGDPERLLAISDALVLCSQREGLPRVVVQAGIAGVPATVTDLPGIDLIVRNGETGFVLPTENLQAVGRALLQLIDEPETRAAMSRSLAGADYSAWDSATMCARIDAAYKSAFARKPLSRRHQ